MSSASSASFSCPASALPGSQAAGLNDRFGKGPCAWTLSSVEAGGAGGEGADKGEMGSRVFSSRRLSFRLTCVWFAVLLCVFGLALPAEAAGVVQFPGVTPVGTSAAAQTVTVTMSAAGSLSAIKVRTQGNDGFDYTNAGGGSCSTSASYAPGQQCTVVVGFKPTAPGERRGAVVLVASGGGVLGTALMDGLASGPLAVFIPGQVNTVAGDSVWIYDGEGPATGHAFFLPFGVTVDAAGNLYITDTSNTRIRKVDAVTQMTSTIAGTGNIGGTGDGGPATQASLSSPTSVVLDAAGNVYFADSGNNVVRKINVFDGTISTVVGVMGQHGYSGNGGPANAATLNGPNGLAFDSAGNLYIADTGNDAVRKVNGVTGVITTLAGNGVAGYADNGTAAGSVLNSPWGVATSPAGDVYIADQNNNIIRKVDTAGRMTTVAGTRAQGFSGDGGLATVARLNVPSSMVMDAAGNLYIADSGNNAVRKINAVTGVISTIAGDTTGGMSGDGGPATSAGIYGPYTLALDGQGNLYVADVFHNRIRKVSANAATLLYPVMRVGRVSAPQQQTLENDGNAALNVASVVAVQQSKVDQASTTCSLSVPLATLAQCQVGADFAPTQTGKPVQGQVSVGSDAANSPGLITLQGEVQDTDPTTLTLTSSLNPSTTGQTVTFVVTATSAGSTPTGTVNLMDGATQIATGVLAAGGTIQFNVSTLTAGQHPLTAQYLGDTSNGASASAVLNQVVKDVVSATTTSVSANINPLNAGATVQFTAVVSVVTAGAGTGEITGNMVFTDGVTQLGSAAVSNGIATLNVSTLGVGTHHVIASYGGNANYSPSKSGAFDEVVVISSSRTALSTSANPSVAGAPLTLTATVLTNGGIATGAVTFLDGTTVLGTGTLNKSGVATATVAGTAWTVGTHTLTANYGGDANDTGSVSGAVAQVVNLATTSVVVTSSVNPVGLGGPVTFTATVVGNGGIPTGTVQFFDANVLLGAGTLTANGVATLTTATLALGSHPITAVYGGDAYDGTSTSASMTEVVEPTTTAIAFETSGNPVVYQQPLVLKAVVSGTGGKPTGTVSFTDGGLSIGSVAVDANGVATFTTSLLELGIHPLVAVYGGDANHGSATSKTIDEDVRQATNTTITVNTQSSIAGLPVQWTVKVEGLSGRSLTGTAGIYDGTALMATVTLDAAGGAVYSSANVSPGQHSVSAKYSGDAKDFESTSTPVNDTVEIATTATTLTTSANPVNSGTALVMTSVVTGNGGVPTGSVTFLDGTAVLSVVPLTTTGGVTGATLTMSTLAPGIHQISASYGGDTLDKGSVSASISQQVAQKTGVTLVSSANPSLLTDDVRITVTVSNGVPTAVPTGLVTLTDGGVLLGTGGVNAAGVVVFTMTAPTLGTHTLVASYAGDAQNLPAATQPFNQTVVLRPTTNTFTASATALSEGQKVVLVSVVQGPGPRPPTGTVTFASGSTVLGTASISATGVATLSVQPVQGSYNVVSTYGGDALYAASNSTALGIVVGPTIQFAINMTPSALTIKSGEHATLKVNITTASTFVDTLAIGCAGLPQAATCTFSENDIKVSGGLAKTITVTVDTGAPLGAGSNVNVARNEHSGGGMTGVLACMLPAGLLGLFFGRKRIKRPMGLLAMTLLLGAMATLSGCANSFSMIKTEPGAYTFQVVGSGITTGATQGGNVKLTVTP